MFHEWLSNLETQQTNFQGGEPREWDPQLIEWLKRVNNPVLRVVYFCVDSILEGYITDFGIDTITSHSEAKKFVFQGQCSRYLSSLKTWIKMILCEKGILRMK